MDDLDHPKETPEQSATRLWGNADLTRRFLEEKRKLPPQPATKVIEVIETEQPQAFWEHHKLERKFLKDIRAMLEGHTHRNLLDYKRAHTSQNSQAEAREAEKTDGATCSRHAT